MRKEIKAYGNTNVIVLTKSDLKLYGLNQGDVVEFTITEVINNSLKQRESSASFSNHKKNAVHNSKQLGGLK